MKKYTKLFLIISIMLIVGIPLTFWADNNLPDPSMMVAIISLMQLILLASWIPAFIMSILEFFGISFFKSKETDVVPNDEVRE